MLEDRRLLAFDAPILNFDGQGQSGFFLAPPDTVGDVGKDHYIQMINSWDGSQFTVYDKQTGQIELGPITTSSLAAPGSACTLGAGDPIVLYDHLADRWLISEFRPPSAFQNGMCVYISQTSDPTDNQWYNYYVPTITSFPDYPKFAVWPSAYVITTNEGVSAVYALDRTNMLKGAPMRPVVSDFVTPLGGFLFQSLTPADLDGPAGPNGSPAYLMRHRDDELHFGTDPINVDGFGTIPFDPWNDYLEIYAVNVDFDRTELRITQLPDIPVSEFDSELCGEALNCLPQPPLAGGVPAPGLDPIGQVIMNRLQYRNFGDYQTLVGNFTMDTNQLDHAGIRWFELRKTGSGPWKLHQEGTVTPDLDNRFMGSIAMDGKGNIALAYSVTSVNTSPSLRYVGRRASDPLGTMPMGEYTIVDGIGSQDYSPRWGDYSTMSVDPVGDQTFYFTGQYVNGTDWATRIAAMSIERPRSDFPPGPGREISGLKWNDRNGNGVRDPGEPTLSQQKIFIDLNRDGLLGICEPVTYTDQNGRYRFRDLDPGTYQVREILDVGWQQTFPTTAEGTHLVTVFNQGGPVNVDFGNQRVPGVEFTVDYGDAPGPFPTRIDQNGASHKIVPGFSLGPLVDGEANGQPNSLATGDDLNGPDEDGVFFTTDLIPGRQATVEVTVQHGDRPPGLLQAWIDFDADGAWTSPGEQIFRDLSVRQGVNTLTFTVPAWAFVSDTFARFRYGYERGISFDGAAIAGEVEDHLVRIQRGGPTANPDFFTVRRKSVDNDLDVMANDLIRPESPTRIVAVSEPNRGGTVQIAEDGRSVLYTPADGFTGNERFAYVLRDAEGIEDSAAVDVFVQPDLAMLGLRALDLNGSPISQIQVGQEFLLQGFVQDLRPMGTGVFAAYLDVEFPSAAFTALGPIAFGAEYQNGQSGSLTTPGLIDEVGAFDGLERLGTDEYMLFTVPMQAEEVGSFTFVAGPADVQPQHGVLLFDRNDPVPPGFIEYAPFSMTTVGGASQLLRNPRNAMDVNDDTAVSPLDALLVINELNSAGRTPAAHGAGTDQLFLDVNGDSFLSPLDALVVINELNRAKTPAKTMELNAVAAAMANAAATAEGESALEDITASTASLPQRETAQIADDLLAQPQQIFDMQDERTGVLHEELVEEDLSSVLDLISDEVAQIQR